jgi:hypothetical protein
MSDEYLDDDIDHALLAADGPSTRGWTARARGMDMTEAMRGMRTYAQITIDLPIEQWRTVKAHIDTVGTGQGAYLRQALATRLISEGINPDDIPDLLAPRRGPRGAPTS